MIWPAARLGRNELLLGRRSLMPAKLPIYRLLPDPWRGRIGLRRGRRWLQALSFERRHNARQPARAPTVNFYPMRPGPNSSMAYILARLGARIGHQPRADQLTLAWDTGTYFSPAAERRLPGDTINRRCLDISKGTVDRLWEQVAGYSITVDPLTTSGPIVVKPQLNGQHAGRVVDGPLARLEPGLVHQRLVDSRDESGRILHLRLVLIGGQIVLTYAKWRDYPHWFQGVELTLPRATDEFLSPAEQRLLRRFADALGLEYGEIDALRDRESGLVYPVDANRTPVRPKGLPVESVAEAFGPQAEAFAALIVR